MAAAEESFGERILKRRISLGELQEYTTSPATVAEDILSEKGVILLPKGTQLASLVSSVEDLEKNLRRWGIFSIPIVIYNKLDIQELEEILQAAEAKISTIDPELARQTLAQVGDVYGRIAEGAQGPEDISKLADQGRQLAAEVAHSPQVMFCLGKVRNWDEYTYVHSLNVALLGGFLAARMFPGQQDLAECLSVGGILHDLGKARVPQQVLNKPGKLTDDEFAIMKRHPLLGEELAIESGVSDSRILSVIRSHHERFGGGGYPDAFLKEQIPTEAKIAAVADVFDALTAKRVYKEPMESRTALSIMIESMGAHFDPHVVRVLLLSIGLYPPGTAVELSDGSIGVVVGARNKDLVRPQVLLKIDSMGRKMDKMQIVDLSVGTSLCVRRTLLDVGKVRF
ncbi:MAG: HD-GYP domain-containing protein [Synergistaceae bacterium]|jgi:HD-GYP domain-containing protein (c-di-GMP phosphodiesterase class II)|nr:HD-GYP domain-containing protein [Synergistaceae bacterium]